MAYNQNILEEVMPDPPVTEDSFPEGTWGRVISRISYGMLSKGISFEESTRAILPILNLICDPEEKYKETWVEMDKLLSKAVRAKKKDDQKNPRDD